LEPQHARYISLLSDHLSECHVLTNPYQNLSSKGCNLVINYTSDSSTEKTKKLADKLQSQYGVQCLSVQADMGSENGPQHIVTMAQNHFAHPKTGKLQIDIVVNNAGVAGKSPLQDCNCEEFARLYNVNVRGPMLLMKAVLPHLPTDRSGRVVNVTSVSSSLGFYDDGMYGGTKAALEAFTRTWARELAERCTVNAVNPGPVATDMYSGTTVEFQKNMAPFIKAAPLAAVRPGVDDQEFVDGAEVAGGRPVSQLRLPQRHRDLAFC
jgi:NAD(P)-dependent dehydrogenase (short-subunit alcohol dehydrogenase family)